MHYHRLKIFLLLSLFFSAFALTLIGFGALSDLELVTWDARLKFLAARSQHDPKIKIILIDQASIDHYADVEQITWPWPRAMYVPVLDFLRKSGARGAAFDLIFSEPSSYGVEDDQELNRAIEGSLPVVSALVLSKSRRSEDREKLKALKDRIVQDNYIKKFKNYLDYQYPSAILPISELINTSHGFGNVSAEPDRDGVFRHYRAGGLLLQMPILSLPFALFELTNPKDELVEYLRSVDDNEGRLAVKLFGGAGTYETFNIRAVINSAVLHEQGQRGIIDPDRFKDSYVFIGLSAAGLLDSRPTPLAQVYPGVEYNATVLDNILNRSFIRKASFIENALSAVVFIMLSAACTIFVLTLWIQILSFVLVTIGFVLLGWSLAGIGIWLVMAPTFVGMLLTLLSAIAIQYYFEGRQHRFIKAAFRYYLSPDLVEQISRKPELLALGGEKRQLTMLFTDLLGFTEFSEQHDPKRVTTIMNRYLSAMTDVVLAHGGTLDKYIGDAIMAFWNAPLLMPDHPERAVATALDYQNRLAQLRVTFKREFDFEPYARIGIHTGEVSVGNFGSLKRFNYTVIGDAVNLASRLEGANKAFGTFTLVSQSTVQQCRDKFIWRRVGDIRVVGRRDSITVYEPLACIGDHSAERAGWLKQWDLLLAAFERADFEEVRKLASTLGDDALTQTYLERVNHDQEIFGPTPHDRLARGWTAVWNLVEK